jgi:tyrosine-protein phosphatase YwqE
MSQKLPKAILLVDYENIQNIDLSIIYDEDITIKIFLGHTQNKIPIELVQNTQQFGQRVEWIKVEGSGNNALDFHIAFYLGKFAKETEGIAFLILSKDKGFDPLIKHINKNKIKCRRIQSLLELFPEKAHNSVTKEPLIEIVEKLVKIQKNKRPRTKQTLTQYIKSLLTKKQLSDRDIETLVDTLFVQEKISESNNRLTYNF